MGQEIRGVKKENLPLEAFRSSLVQGSQHAQVLCLGYQCLNLNTSQSLNVLFLLQAILSRYYEISWLTFKKHDKGFPLRMSPWKTVDCQYHYYRKTGGIICQLYFLFIRPVVMFFFLEAEMELLRHQNLLLLRLVNEETDLKFYFDSKIEVIKQ